MTGTTRRWRKRWAAFGLGLLMGAGLPLAMWAFSAKAGPQASPLDAGRVAERLSVLERRFYVDAALGAVTIPAPGARLAPQAGRDLRPGWIARVFVAPDVPADDLSGDDVGLFVLDEQRFSLTAHEGHMIDQPRLAAYKLNGLYHAEQAGQHQLGLTVKVAGLSKDAAYQVPVCHLRVSVKDRRIIDRRIVFSPHAAVGMVDGAIDLDPGLHAAEVVISCALPPGHAGSHVTVTLGDRPPGASAIAPRPGVFLHMVRS
ncbi:MAG: hypothetical protein KDE22_07145 [Rhodobacterales bacterium]|nr:hypothetical protein [Rhodobacterales bacterium]